VSVLGLSRIVLQNTIFYISGKTLPKLASMITRDSFDYVNKHSISYFNNEMSGNVSFKVRQLANSTRDFLDNSFEIVHVFAALLTSCILLFITSSYFILPILFWGVIMFFIGRHFGLKRYKFSKDLGQIESDTSGQIVDSISNYSEIKSFANFKFERVNLNKHLKKLRQAEIKERVVRAHAMSVQSMIVVASIASFLFYTIYLLKEGQLSTVDFIFANTIFSMMSWSIFEVSGFSHRMSHIFGRIQSSLDTLAVDPDIVDKKGAIKLSASKIQIDMDCVSFSYPNHDKLFKGLNIHIKPGEKVGLVGHSGSGKSTFIKLIARYYDIQEGAIKINSTDIRDITQDSLRKHISTIPQDINLFNRTLMENIRYGKTSASDDEVIKAAQKAFADEFIKDFPEGYGTKVGERGVVLSGGERQRIAIARAILKNAPLLIFDEATSALDSKSEQHIQKSLKQLMKNKTVIAIAHRLSTLREMDRILIFDKGKIVEEGTHLGLLRKKGIYSKLYSMQSDGLIGTDRDNKEQETTL
jgi:ATP-binding cassette subfamily B protein